MKKRIILGRKLKALANHKRLQILGELKEGRSADVSSLAKKIQLSVRATSKHLKILSAADIVVPRKRGFHVFYRISVAQDALVKHILTSL